MPPAGMSGEGRRACTWIRGSGCRRQNFGVSGMKNGKREVNSEKGSSEEVARKKVISEKGNRTEGRRRGKRRIALLAGLALAVIAGAAAAAGMGPFRRGVPVEMARAELRDVEDRISEDGRISASERVLYIAEVSGPVEEVAVAENSQVRAGDLLFRLSDSEYRSAEKTAESAAEGLKALLEETRIGQVMTAAPTEYLETLSQRQAAAEAALRAAKADWEGSAALLQTGAVSENQYRQSEAAYRAAETEAKEAGLRLQESRALLKELQDSGVSYETINRRFFESGTARIEAELQAKEEEISLLKEKIGKCVVFAKEDGLVASLPVKDQTYLAAGQLAAELLPGGGDQLTAEAEVLTSAAPYIRPGDPVTAELTLRGRNQILRGTVTEVYDFAERQQSALGLDEYRVKVKAVLEPPEETAGDSARAGGAANAASGAVESAGGMSAGNAAAGGTSAPELRGLRGYGAELSFILYRGEQVLAVPASAVFQSGGRDWVYVAEGGRAAQREVVLDYETPSWAVVREGLLEGEAVIRTADTEGLYDGAAVSWRGK